MRESTRRDVLRATAAAGATVGLAGCVGGGSGGDVDALDAPAGTKVVKVGPNDSYNFRPESLTVAPGTTVRFVWLSSGHNVVPTSQPADADWAGVEALKERGFYHEHAFDVPGTYEYVCRPHQQFGMRGSVTVEE
ncbi:MAG: plastocyanin/azurin family copper-binding protein [Halobacterium sp.]